MIINSQLAFICANEKPKKDGEKFYSGTFMSNNETQVFPLSADCYTYLQNHKVTPLTNLNVAIDLGAYNGEKTYRLVGLALPSK